MRNSERKRTTRPEYSGHQASASAYSSFQMPMPCKWTGRKGALDELAKSFPPESNT